ncbi:MAG: glyoxalase [Flavobacteriia bacterium]|jgi:hypothetical protein
MDSRDVLKQILPVIEVEELNSLPIETFQTKTLRPILKFQNALILSVFNTFLIEYKVDFINLSKEKKKLKISEILKENLQVKQFYLGIIVAFFTQEELTLYFENKKEINKRIIALLIERISSQIGDINQV